MAERISLDGEWTLAVAEHLGDCREVPARFHGLVVPAQVPGDVHLDLIRAGALPEDLFAGFNIDHTAWVEGKDWWYRREFPTPPGAEGREVFLVFHGLDCYATVWLNGVEIGRSANMFIRHEWRATSRLNRSGPNRLDVRLASPTFMIPLDPAHKPMVWSPERLFSRKAQMSFGWDIAPRLVTAGIWRPVELVVADKARITGLSARTKRIEDGRAVVSIEASVEWLAPDAGAAVLRGTFGETAWEAAANFLPGPNTVTRDIEISAPRLWWPLGYGKQELYGVTAVLEAAGATQDERSITTGIRTVELVEKPQPSGATSFFFRCNGRDVFITGLNWTPLDALFARITPAKTTTALEMIAGINCNMIRVWGGGFYDSPHFYSECDRLGILVWQDFMMACGWYPQDDWFAGVMREEASQVVRDLRHHPSIAIWAGDNENDAFYPELVRNNRITRQVLRAVCEELDPGRPYVPSSPYSPSGKDPGGQTDGDWHGYAHGESYKTPWLWDLKARFVSEFGHLSLPSIELIRQSFPAGTEWPLTGDMWKYHGADTIRVGHFRGAGHILRSLKAAGRPEPGNIGEAVKASQELQAEAVVAWIERYCADPEFGGFMLWNVSDCWPQQSDAITDYGLTPKLVYSRLGPLFEKVRREHPRVLVKE